MNENEISRIRPLDLESEMKKSFISYAMAVIINRALPDVRDGLKPVHRRILYSMDEQGFTADKPFHKSARIVGDVLGKYHPHGDSSVYDAMVRLAQDFNSRYMLIEGQGNFGSVDGDGAAAMRYTEARMSKLADEMMADIGKNTVDFMTRNGLTPEQRKTLNWDSTKGHGYGNFMRILEDPAAAGLIQSEGSFGWDGWMGCYFSLDPKEQLCILYFIQQTGAGTTDSARRLQNIAWGAVK